MLAMGHASTVGARRTSGPRRRVVVLAALAAWAMSVPWLARAVGAELDVTTRLEVIDHVVPGAVVLACCGALLHPSASAALGGVYRLGLAGTACLAGFWITATHAGLLPEAIDGVSPWVAALLHFSAGPPITAWSLWMLLADPGR